MIPRSADILVLGAGLAGAGAALELARRGMRVTLVDQDVRPLNRASLRNEGKIHLGLIYANDASRETAFLQLDGALRFREIVARWIGEAIQGQTLSAPFLYMVASDSILAPDTLVDHYSAVETQFRRRITENASLDYLGDRPERLVRRLTESEIARYFDPSRFVAGFATAERAVDLEILAASIRLAVAESPGITFLPSHSVRNLAEETDGFLVEGDSPEGVWRIHARQLVNASSERRPALDRQLGMQPPADLLHRLKFRVIARLPPDLRGGPSVSMVLGRYGDVVVRPDGTAYLSWYPAGLRGWSHEIQPPAEWNLPCRGEVLPAQASLIAAETTAGIDAWYPGIARCEPLTVDAGAIVALGRSDVDKPGSALHGRSRIGVTSRGGYHSLDPGKLTTAPLFAVQAADRVEALHTGRNL